MPHRRSTTGAALIAVALSIAPTLAFADAQELRLSLSLDGGRSTVVAFSGRGSFWAPLMAGGVSYGLSDAFSVGGSLAYSQRNDVDLVGAQMGSVGGEGLVLYADVKRYEAWASAWLTFDTWFSERLVRFHPFVAAHVGAELRDLSSLELLGPRGRLFGAADRQVRVRFSRAFEGGARYRLSPALSVGFSLVSSFMGAGDRMLAARVSMAWIL